MENKPSTVSIYTQKTENVLSNNNQQIPEEINADIRNKTLFKIGDNVRISHGIVNRENRNNENYLPVYEDSTVGNIGKVFGIILPNGERVKKYDKKCDIRNYDENIILEIDISDGDESGSFEVIKIPAVDVTNITLLQEKEYKIHCETCDHRLPWDYMFNDLLPWDVDFSDIKDPAKMDNNHIALCKLEKDNQSLIDIQEAKNEFEKVAIQFYRKQFYQIVDVKRKQRWQYHVDYLKKNKRTKNQAKKEASSSVDPSTKEGASSSEVSNAKVGESVDKETNKVDVGNNDFSSDSTKEKEGTSDHKESNKQDEDSPYRRYCLRVEKLLEEPMTDSDEDHNNEIVSGKRPFFTIGDRVRVANGFIINKEYDASNLNLKIPTSCKDDPTIGRFGTIIQMTCGSSDKRFGLLGTRKVQEFTSTDINEKCFIDVKLDEEVAISKKVVEQLQFDWVQLVNYSYLGQEKADEIYKLSHDTDLIWYFDVFKRHEFCTEDRPIYDAQDKKNLSLYKDMVRMRKNHLILIYKEQFVQWIDLKRRYLLKSLQDKLFNALNKRRKRKRSANH